MSTTLSRWFLAVFCTISLSAFTASCAKDKSAGDHMEEAAENVEEAGEEAADNVKDAVEEAGDKVEDATD